MVQSEDWKTRYSAKVVSADEAAGSISSGQRVFVGTACAAPRTLIAALEDLSRKPDIELIHFITTDAFPHDVAGRSQTRYRHRTFFVSSDIRAAVSQGLAQYVPMQVSQVPGMIARGSLPIDVAIIQVSTPDAFGYVSFGISVDIVASAATAARVVIAEVNPAMPRTNGDTTFHVDDIAMLVPVHGHVTEYAHIPVTEAIVLRIARYIAGIIDDGSTLQVGLGRIPNEALRYLVDRKDLGIHSDVITDAILPLLKSGIITGRQKTRGRGKIVTSFALGSRALYEIMDDNPLFSLHPIDRVADESEIAAQNKMVSVSQAFSIDLSGQACIDQFDGELYGGLGAQIDFIRGTARSIGGKPIVCLTSTTDDGQGTRIRAVLAPGEAAGIARSDVHYVVTEYGIAYLHGKSIRERALSLIAIAHPTFRETLLHEAKELGFLEPSCTIRNAFPYPVEDEELVAVKNGKTIMLRPAMVFDAAEIRSLFYQLSDHDRYTRFFRKIRLLSNDDIERLCNVDYNLAVAFVATYGSRENYRVVGHASYFVNPSTNLAETAFMVSPEWQKTGLGSALQSCLIKHAKARNIRGFVAEILPTNTPMIRLAQKGLGTVSMTSDQDGVYVQTLF